MDKNTVLIWLDLEMSGLDPETDVILQSAIIPTNNDLKILDDGLVCYVQQEKELLENMNEWNQETHTKTGLLEKCLNSKTNLKEVENICLSYLKKWTKKKKSPLCGNSIGQDRRFLYRYMPYVADFMHYRNLDISSFKILKDISYLFIPDFKKQNTHEALLDIQESIMELAYYKKHLLIKPR